MEQVGLEAGLHALTYFLDAYEILEVQCTNA